MSGRLYQINPTCSQCKEEHMWWNVRLTDEEQKKLDHHTEVHKAESELYSLLSEPAIIITRKLKCGECGVEFEARVGIWKEMEVGWHHPDFVDVGKHML